MATITALANVPGADADAEELVRPGLTFGIVHRPARRRFVNHVLELLDFFGRHLNHRHCPFGYFHGICPLVICGIIAAHRPLSAQRAIRTNHTSGSGLANGPGLLNPATSSAKAKPTLAKTSLSRLTSNTRRLSFLCLRVRFDSAICFSVMLITSFPTCVERDDLTILDSPIQCPTLSVMRYSQPYHNAVALQNLVLADAKAPETTPRERALLARAFKELEELKLRLRMKPAPKPIDVEVKSKVRPRNVVSFTESPEPVEANQKQDQRIAR